ncbi:hypothetical protein C0989_000634 [Termitomyces sp. Mn162]|nr:hypothetical protein C0989_000634 [Termitomyces sp. Mn162]
MLPPFYSYTYKFTATRSIFVLTAGSVDVTVTFLSPVEATDLVKQSTPFAYMAVSAASNDNAAHSVQVYSDITAEWVSANLSDTVEWSTSAVGNVITHQFQSQLPSVFSEYQDHVQSLSRAQSLDSKVNSDASKISADYAAIVELSIRQAVGATEITISRNPDGTWNTDDVIVFLKGITVIFWKYHSV